MRPTLSIIALAVSALAAASALASTSTKYPKVHFTDTDGLSKATAIVITGANGEKQGVDAEYEWLDSRFPGWQLVNQGIDGGDSVYDRMRIREASGDERVVYFDIADFFGK